MEDFVSYMKSGPYVVVFLIEHLHLSDTWQGIGVDEIGVCAQI
jgi:hypothetical protein